MLWNETILTFCLRCHVEKIGFALPEGHCRPRAKWTIFKSSYSRSQANSKGPALFRGKWLSNKTFTIFNRWFYEENSTFVMKKIPPSFTIVRVFVFSNLSSWWYLSGSSAWRLWCRQWWHLRFVNLIWFWRANIQFALNKQWELCKQRYQVATINSMRRIISG